MDIHEIIADVKADDARLLGRELGIEIENFGTGLAHVAIMKRQFNSMKSDYAELLKAYEILEKFAKDNGCAGIELIGRPGWSRHVAKQGFDTKSVMYQKFFERGKDEPK